MRIFLYEFVTGGGWYHVDSKPPQGSLLAEGKAMLESAAADFAAIPAARVVTFRDSRLPPLRLPPNIEVRQISSSRREQTQFEELAHDAAVLVIAPELNGYLLDRIRCVEDLGGRLLSPSREFVEIAGDKWQTHQRLIRGGVPTPKSRLQRSDRAWRARTGVEVIKPVDGCGSLYVEALAPGDEFEWSGFPGSVALVQEYCPGLATSVAVLCGPHANYGLPVCQQRLSEDGEFRYLGGELPLTDALNFAAQKLALKALRTMPPTIGYVGVDLILGAAKDGSQDYVIEINPRLTTSYVGLRALSNTNLAQAMLDVVEGREPKLAWKPGRVSWSADGAVEYFGV